MEKKDYIWKELYDYNDFDTRCEPLTWKIVAVDFKDRFIVEFDDIEDEAVVVGNPARVIKHKKDIIHKHAVWRFLIWIYEFNMQQ